MVAQNILVILPTHGEGLSVQSLAHRSGCSEQADKVIDGTTEFPSSKSMLPARLRFRFVLVASAATVAVK
jgi:hypothetical protein